jgi:hypothetical protein
MIDALDPVGNVFYIAANALHPVVDFLHIATDILYFPLDTLNLVSDIMHIAADILYLLPNTFHPIIDAVRNLQQFRRCHPCLFLCQFVQSLKTILDIRVSRQRLKIPFLTRRQSRIVNLCEINSLSRPRFTSFVAIARIDSTSTMISVIISLIAMVGVMPVYISRRRKKRSMRLKTSMSLSWRAPVSLAVWEHWMSKLFA